MMRGTPPFAHYVSSKGGVVSFTRAIAKESGAEGICVNSVDFGLTTNDAMQSEPGYSEERFVRTMSRRALARGQTPDDLVGTVVFLPHRRAILSQGNALELTAEITFIRLNQLWFFTDGKMDFVIERLNASLGAEITGIDVRYINSQSQQQSRNALNQF